MKLPSLRRKTVAVAAPVVPHNCKRCDRPFETGTDRRRKLCDWCRKADKHRNGARAARLPKMFVSIDGEGKQIDGIMHLMTISIGREDGSSATYVVQDDDVRAALMWLVDNVSQHYTNAEGQTYRQVPVAFHFGWDSATIARYFDPKTMYVIRKVQAKLRTSLCGSTHKDGETCPYEAEDQRRRQIHLEAQEFGLEVADDEDEPFTDLYHRYSAKDCETIITHEGEGDVIALDRQSMLAFAITPGRRFHLEHRPNGDRFEGWRRVDIHDTGTAFIGGLEKVISDWNPELTDDQRAIIKWGKEHRKDGTFDMSLIDSIAAYSEAECVAHARCCRLLIDLIKEAAYVTMKETELYGSGSIAGAALKHNGAPRRKSTAKHVGSDLRFEHIAQQTYFGGMIETPVVGLVKGITDEVDINSAYPHKMISIPCMREGCGSWAATDGEIPAGAVVGHARVRWAMADGTSSTPPFIVRRKDGRVGMPLSMDQYTWVTLSEYQAAAERFQGGTECAIPADKVLYWAPDCVCDSPRPFEFLGHLYDRRLQFKGQMKDVPSGSPEWWNLSCKEKAIKLVINSIYGKLAQQDPKPGAYTNLHLASYITGATRAQVRVETWAREAQGGIVVYQHTDSVLSIGGTPTDGGKTLGAWGMEKSSKDFLIIQPGLATALGGGKHASRGCRLGAFQEAVEDWLTKVDLTQHPTEWPKLVTHQVVMVSRRQAIAWGKPQLAGSFQPKTTEISAISLKRDIDSAKPMTGIPTAWVVPPLDMIENPATLEDIMKIRGSYAEKRRAGEYDNR